MSAFSRCGKGQGCRLKPAPPPEHLWGFLGLMVHNICILQWIYRALLMKKSQIPRRRAPSRSAPYLSESIQYTVRHNSRYLKPLPIPQRPFLPAESSESPAIEDTDRKASGVVAARDEKQNSAALATLGRPTRLDKNLRQTEPFLTQSPFENPPPYHYSAVL